MRDRSLGIEGGNREPLLSKMGSKHSLMDDLVNFKMTSKQMNASARKCEKNQATQKAKLKKAIEQKNIEGARIYAQNVIREKESSTKLSTDGKSY